jgi:hypothetical protein
MTKIIFGKWEPHHCCVECNTFIPDSKRFRSGTCPYCGNAEGCTIVKTHNLPRRPVYEERKILGIFPWRTFLRWEHKPEHKNIQFSG